MSARQRTQDARPREATAEPMTWRSAPTAEARAGLLAEARELGNVTVAAEALDVSRQHMHRLLSERGAPRPRPARVSLSVALDRELVEWLDLEAVRVKHRSGSGKASKAQVLVELIRQAMGSRS